MKRILFSSVFLLIVTFSSAYFFSTQAQTTLPLTVFPATQDVSIEPDKPTRFQVQFRNGSNEALPGFIRVADFAVVDAVGTVELIEGTVTKPKYSASSWIRLDNDRITIPARDFVTVDLYVNTPKSITTCGKYALVYFEPNPSAISGLAAGPERKSSALISAKLGALVNLKYEGVSCKESVRISSLTSSSFLEYGPLPISFSVVNGGDAHITPQNTVTVKNLFGQVVDQQTIQDQRIFPEKERLFELSSGNRWMIGKYTIAVRSIIQGKANLQDSKTISVIVFPWKVAAIIILALIITTILIKRTYLSTKKHTSELEKEVKEEKEEIDRLKEALKKREG